MEEHNMSKHYLGKLNIAYATLSPAEKLLYQGAIKNDVNLVKEALDSDPKIINSNLGGGTHYVGFRAIHWAAANGSLAVIRELKQHNVDLTKRAGADWIKKHVAEPQKFELSLETAAYYLWNDGHPQRDEILGELRLDPKNITSREELLYLGAITNDLTYLEAALELRVNVNQNLGNLKDTNFTALHWAAKFNSEEAMKWLIRNGADEIKKTGRGLTYKEVSAEYEATEQRLSYVGAGITSACRAVGIWSYGKKDCVGIGKNVSQAIAKASDHVRDVCQMLPEEAKERIPKGVRKIVEIVPPVIDKICKEENITFRY